MKEDILGTIVEVEKEIAQNLKKEEVRSEEYLSGLRKKAERELLEEEARLQNAFTPSVAQARTAAELKAGAIQQEAKVRAHMLENLSDDILKKVLRNHLSRILQ